MFARVPHRCNNAGPWIALVQGDRKRNLGRVGMIEKLSSGVLRVLTPLGPRYVRPSFLQRLYLLWLFRNFPLLSPQVLSRRQQQIIDGFCNQHGFISLNYQNGLVDAPVIGTLERRPPVDVRKPNAQEGTAETAPVRPMDELRQRS